MIKPVCAYYQARKCIMKVVIIDDGGDDDSDADVKMMVRTVMVMVVLMVMIMVMVIVVMMIVMMLMVLTVISYISMVTIYNQHIPFLIWNQSVVPCLVLTAAF